MTPSLVEVETILLDLTNAFRRGERLGALRRDRTLDTAARSYATYLARTGKFSHTADGRSFSDRIKAAGYSACLSAENLALNGDSRGFAAGQLARDVIEGWKNSPGHRKNMMIALATDIGLGVAKAASSHTYYSVQLFGRPEALRQKIRIENRTTLSIAYSLDRRPQQLDPRTIVTHSTCAPAEVVMLPAAGYTLDVQTARALLSRDGDTLVLSLATSGALGVRHIPRTR